MRLNFLVTYWQDGIQHKAVVQADDLDHAGDLADRMDLPGGTYLVEELEPKPLSERETELLSMIRQGIALMPLGTAKRGDWVIAATELSKGFEV